MGKRPAKIIQQIPVPLFAGGMELGSSPIILTLTEDGDSVWASFDYYDIKGMFIVRD